MPIEQARRGYAHERPTYVSHYSPEPIESTVDELPGLSLPKEFEQMMLRGNAERLFPRFKL